jgi:hypothetical protein
MTVEPACVLGRRAGVRPLGFLLLPLAVILAACGSTSTIASSTSTTASTTATSSTTTAPHPSSSTTPRNAAPNAFLGDWYVHGCSLHVITDTEGVQRCFFGGQGVSEINTLVLFLSRHPLRLKATVSKVTFVSNDTGRVVANPFPNESDAVGDVFILTFVAPHLLVTHFVVSHRAPIDVKYGNPYWCGDGLATSLGHLCGA